MFKSVTENVGQSSFLLEWKTLADIVELFLLDCSGKEIYMEQLGEMLKEADMVVAVYDVTKTESFGNVAKVVNVLTTFCRLSFKRLFKKNHFQTRSGQTTCSVFLKWMLINLKWATSVKTFTKAWASFFELWYHS